MSASNADPLSSQQKNNNTDISSTTRKKVLTKKKLTDADVEIEKRDAELQILRAEGVFRNPIYSNDMQSSLLTHY